MGTPQTFAKRQREQARRERQQQKKEKRAERKTERVPGEGPEISDEVVREEEVTDIV